MKITHIKTWLVEGIKYNWTLVKVFTDSGLTGIGEATNWPGSPMVEAACQHVAQLLIGEDPSRIDYLYTKLYRDMNYVGRGGPLQSAISAIDIALWDILGKRAGLPVYELLGGAYRKRIELYANYWFLEGTGAPEDYARQARSMAALGFGACKFDPFAHVDYRWGDDLQLNGSLTEAQKRLAMERLLAVSDALGPAFPIAVETHALLNEPTAVEMAHRIAAAKINCMWYEEPAGPEFPAEIANIKRQIPLPVCVGERLHSRYMCRQILDLHAADVLMPDVTRCGGISELRKIATLCETYNVPIAPHNPNGPISTIASAHVMAATPNFFRQEFMLMDVPWRDTILDKPLPVRDGHFHLSAEPGLGFDLIEAEVEKHPGVRTAREGFYI
ncbi:MAG: mandelate racemase/muconate lactonizing enzyme family protein [Bryobacteraceae bacterium]